jgi:malate permease and related proteins
MEQMIVSLTPVFIILAVGFLTRRLGIIGAPAITGLKNVLIKIALPGALFMAFAAADMRVENIWIFLSIFCFCVILYFLGGLLHRLVPGVFPDEYTNGYFTGFEFGMIGIGLFTAIWGMERLPTIAMIAFGHEVFIWFVYVPILESRKTGKVHVGKIVKDFFQTPTVIAILLGVLVNVTGIYPKLSSVTVGMALLNCLKMLTAMVAPLILLMIGHSLTFKKIPLKKSIALLLTRWSAVLGLGYALNTLMNRMMTLDDFFPVAFYAFILLPPPFILPLFMKRDLDEEITFFSELLIYYTVLSFIGYVVLMSILA